MRRSAYYRRMEVEEVADALLTDLRALLNRPALALLEPPVRLAGGYDTEIFAFQLKGAPPDFSGRLVLRMFAEGTAQRARFEGTVQSAIADLGYPAPRALHVSESGGSAGRPYIVMPRAEGKQLVSAGIFRLGPMLARSQAALHALDPVPVRRALAAAGCGPIASGIDDWLKTLEGEVSQQGMEPLRASYQWLAANRPRGVTGQSICHLDFHPLNLIAKEGVVTGVIDWSNVSFGDPAADAGFTRVLLTLSPFEVQPWLKPLAQRVRRLIAWHYTRTYLRLRPLTPASLRYYEALRCFEAMSHLSRLRIAEGNGAQVASNGYAWSDPETIKRLTGHFKAITGVELKVVP